MFATIGFIALIAFLAPIVLGTLAGLVIVGVAVSGRMAESSGTASAWKPQAA
jgi:hypothetical protein